MLLSNFLSSVRMHSNQPVTLVAAAPEAANEPKPTAEVGKAQGAPKVRSEAADACERVALSCTHAPKLGGEHLRLFSCSTLPLAARRTTFPTSFVENGSLSKRFHLS